MNWNQALFPSLKRRGGCAIKKMSRSNLSSRRRGGAKRKPDRAQPQEKIGEIFRPEEFRRTDHPVCGASEASRLFINAAATPPLQGGECVRTETVCQFIHTFSALGELAKVTDLGRHFGLGLGNGLTRRMNTSSSSHRARKSEVSTARPRLLWSICSN